MEKFLDTKKQKNRETYFADNKLEKKTNRQQNFPLALIAIFSNPIISSEKIGYTVLDTNKLLYFLLRFQ
jgi:hypothetical protein